MILVGKIRLYILGLIIGILSCESPKEYREIQGEAQGSTFSIIYENTENQDFTEAIFEIFHSMDSSMSLWKPESIISQANQEIDSIQVDSYFREVFIRSNYYYELSEGLFDPTIGPLLNRWGLARKKQTTIPNEEEINNLKKLIGFNHWSLKGNWLFKDNKSIEIDFNAIAQGYTVDVLAEFLEKNGINNYLVEVGGELRTKGKNSRGEKWTIGIEKPDYNLGGEVNSIENIISISGKSLATSGSYRKFIEKDGKKYSHTINPKTGRPVEHQLLSVSVITDKAIDADALATYFMLIGEEKALEYANKNGIAIHCIIAGESENYQILESKKWKELKN